MKAKPTKKRWTRTEWLLLLAPLSIFAALIGWHSYSTYFMPRSFKCSGEVSAVSLSPNGKVLVSANNVALNVSELKFWRAKDGELLHETRLPFRSIESLDIASDGNTVVAACSDGRVRIWNLHSYQVQTTLKGHAADVFTARYSANGKSVLSLGDEGRVLLWDCQKKRLTRILSTKSAGIAGDISSDGKWVAYPRERSRKTRKTHYGTTENYDLGGAIAVVDLKSNSTRQLSAELAREVRFSPDSRVMACLSEPQTTITSGDILTMFDVRTGRELWSRSGFRWRELTSLQFSPDSKIIAAQGEKYQVHLWRASDGKLLKTLSVFSLFNVSESTALSTSAISFSADGKVLVSRYGDEIKLFRLN